MNKMLITRNALLAILLSATMASCDDNDDDSLEATLNVESSTTIQYDANGVWTKCYDTTAEEFKINGFEFSHQASSYEWGGVTYYSWCGFCPSKSTDNAQYDYYPGTHEWSSIIGGGVSGAGSPYIIGFWKSDEGENPQEPSCVMEFDDVETFQPQSAYVTNTSYVYYTLLNGDAYSKKFDNTDWFKLTFYGRIDDKIVSSTDFYLANDGNIVDTWQKVDLSSLGRVDEIMIQLSSSDTGQWGMNTPAYFCIDRITYKY